MFYEINEWIGKLFAVALIAGGVGYGLWYANGQYQGFRKDVRREMQRNVEFSAFDPESEFDVSRLIEQQESAITDFKIENAPSGNLYSPN